MTRSRTKIGEAFPRDDVVARFVVAMCIAGNDVKHATLAAGQANTEEAPEFYYYIGLSMGHTHEGVIALEHWRGEVKVREFLKGLPRTAQKDLKEAANISQRLGQGVLSHTRNRVFHYPYPSDEYTQDQELQEVLGALAAEDTLLTMIGGKPLSYRFDFADKAAMMMALGKFDSDDARLRQQVEQARDGAIAFGRFVGHVFMTYCDQRNLSLGEQELAETGDLDAS